MFNLKPKLIQRVHPIALNQTKLKVISAMRTIIWMSFFICWMRPLCQAQQHSKEYFLVNQKPVYVEKIEQEALLILKPASPKTTKAPLGLSKIIRKHSNQPFAQTTHHHLKVDEKALSNLYSLKKSRRSQERIQAVYPAYRMNDEKVFLSHEVILKTLPGVDILTLQVILDKYAAVITNTLNDEEGLLCLIQLPDSEHVFDLIHELELNKQVVFVEPDWVMISPGGYCQSEITQTQAPINTTIPDDPFFSLQWFLNQNTDADLDAPEAWEIQEGDSTVVVAVIDLHGFDLNHVDIKNNLYYPYNAVTNTNNPIPQNEYARHGTPCAGLIGAISNNQTGIASIGGKIKVMPILIGEGVRSDGLTYVRSSSYVKAANHIVNHPQVVAVSNSFAASSLTSALRVSYERMQKEGRRGLGTLVLASSGNWNQKNQAIYPYYLSGVIGVGATRNNDTRAGFSNYGDSLDLVVPGEGIYTTLNNDQYGYFGGTSASCPIASGIVGLMASQQPNLTAEQLGCLLLRSCDKIAQYNFENKHNYPLGSWNEEVGYGRANAYNALQLILNLNPPAAPIITSNEAISNQEIRLSWQDTSSRSETFMIERSLGDTQSFISIARLSSDSTSFQDTNLQENTQYIYRIQGYSQEGISEYSEMVTIVTLGRPSAPQNLNATLRENTQVILNWATSIGNGQVDNWLIHRYVSNGQGLINDTTIVLGADSIMNQYIDTHLSIPGWYVYDIQASNQYGVSPTSDQVNIAPGAMAISDEAITSCQELLLDPGGATHYTDNQLVSCQLIPVEPNKRVELNFLEFDLEFGRDFLKIYDGEHEYPENLIGEFTGGNIPPVIKANNPTGIISLVFTSDQSVTRPGWQASMRCIAYPPNAPLSLQVDSLGENELKLQWKDLSDNENGFEIWRKSLGNSFEKIFTTNAEDTLYIDQNLNPGTFYTYQIRAVNDGGESEFSNRSSAGTLPLNIATQGFWSKKTDFQSSQTGVGFAVQDKGYVLTSTGIVWEYDPKIGTQGQWIQKSTFPGGGRYNPVAMVINNKAYLGLGFFKSDFWEYDPLTNQWTQVDNYPSGFVRYQQISFTIGNKGYTGIGDGERDLWEFDPTATPGQQWTRMNDMPNEASRRYFPTAFAIGSKGYVTTGFFSSFLGDLWEFDPFEADGGIWKQKADLPVTRAEAVAFAIGDKGYVGTGSRDRGQKLRDFWEYNPKSNQWKQKSDFGGSSRSLSFAINIRAKGYLGGGTGGADFWMYQPAESPEAPESPDSLQLSTNSSLDRVYLNWKDNSIDEQGFEIWRSEGAKDNFTLLTVVNTQTSSYQDAEVQFGKTYYYQVRAFNYIDASAFSNQDSIRLLPEPPTEPTLLEASAIDDAGIFLSWEDQAINEKN